jgi:hypothetical protein
VGVSGVIPTGAVTGPHPGAAPVGLQTGLRTFGRAVVVVLPAWVAARVLVVVTLAVAHGIVSTVRPDNPEARLRVHQGLLAWDGGWYQSIAAHGYVASGLQSLRFFPALPMAARVVGWVPGVGAGPAVVLIANLCSLAAMAALVVLVDHDTGDPGLARRSAWLLGLAPSAYSLVLGYADGPLLLCSVVTLLAARLGRWWWAAAAGLAGGLVRPVGILLVVPVVIEAWRSERTGTAGASTGADRGAGAVRARLLGCGAAVVAPVVGAGIYLGWVESQFHDFLLPFRLQQQSGHRGALTVPLDAMGHNLTAVVHGHHLGSALHIPWVVLCLVLLVLAARRLPASYTAFAAAVLVVSLTSSNLDSFERYALGAFPLVVAASTLTSRRGVEAAVLVLSAAALVGYAMLAFLGMVVP